jgi:hypothetical protein
MGYKVALVKPEALLSQAVAALSWGQRGGNKTHRDRPRLNAMRGRESRLSPDRPNPAETKRRFS